MNGPNHELFVKVLAQIEREPQQWDQSRWAAERSCGTSYCFAGWACVLSGFQANFDREDWFDGERHTHDLKGVIGRGISDQAARLLGIRYELISDLFEGDNDLNKLYEISADLLGVDEQVLRDKVTAEVAS